MFFFLAAHTPPQFVMPPLPPFPFMPFMAPPPMPSKNLRSLTAEELRQMEGNERANLEARIQCLRNIQVSILFKYNPDFNLPVDFTYNKVKWCEKYSFDVYSD